jgi:PAS domain S-box-containing protein
MKVVMESVNLAESFLKDFPDTVGILDNWGRFVYVNPAVEELFQYKPEEIIGTNFTNYLAGGEEELQRFIRTVWEAEKIKNYELKIIRKDGKILHTTVSTSLIKDNIRGINGILAITRDITEQKDLEKKIRETSTHLNYLLENSPDCIAITDKAGRITFFSRGSDYYTQGKKEAKRIMQLLRKKGKIESQEVDFIGKNGKIITLSLSASLLKDDHGKIVGTMGIGRDITQV